MNEITLHADDWRKSLHSLRSHTGFYFVFHDQPPRGSGFAEFSPSEGEAWLRGAAVEGNPFALEKLGLRLINGDGVPAAPGEGIALLKRAAELGNPVAMHRLAELWLSRREHLVEAGHLLVRAMELRYLPAQVALATHLVRGAPLVRDAARGRALLVDAARRGSRMAHIRLAAYLLGGRGMPEDREAGIGWLLRIGATQAPQVGILAAWLHSRALDLPPAERAETTDCAGVLFREAVRQGNVEDEVNLAYLLRRGEIAPEGHGALSGLLEAHVAAGNPHALANQALLLARGVDAAPDWVRADALVAAIADVGSVLRWWSERARAGDAEGHLLVAWLCRHRLTADPQGMTLDARLAPARKAGWEVPSWLQTFSAPPPAVD